jgi:hypothetical protein
MNINVHWTLICAHSKIKIRPCIWETWKGFNSNRLVGVHKQILVGRMFEITINERWFVKPFDLLNVHILVDFSLTLKHLSVSSPGFVKSFEAWLMYVLLCIIPNLINTCCAVLFVLLGVVPLNVHCLHIWYRWYIHVQVYLFMLEWLANNDWQVM